VGRVRENSYKGRWKSMELDEIKTRLASLETSCLCDADKSLPVLDPGIRPIREDLKLIGTAYTATCRNDFLTVIHALGEAEPGDVLVVDGKGGRLALAGELFATEAARKGLGGIVVDGAVRDVETLRKLPIPVYARSFCPVSGMTSRLFESSIPVNCGGITVNPGDMLFGDQDGIIVSTAERLSELIPVAEGILQKESEVLDRMAGGESLINMFNFEEHLENVQAGETSTLKFIV